tara:strand:- start:328 stop:492 length:165 start_codon:yes stop_codon:yes gene_type:complete
MIYCVKGVELMDKNKRERKSIPQNLENKVRPEIVDALKKAHERYDQAFRNLKDR